MNSKQLVALYTQISKHSHYQILAKPLRKLIKTDELEICSRYEEERLNYLLTRIPYKNSSIVDIGANTGYFTLELMAKGTSSALVIEGNSAHAAFVKAAVDYLQWQETVKVSSKYIKFNESSTMTNCDITLLLNVLHHIGDDYDQVARLLGIW